ncbi:MAG: sporulation protein [Defluviitaleaceae bacterium]|nr:sporulation protein [Defluviitaleaceae bacterium]
MSSVSDNLQALFSKMENFVSTKTVVGEPVHFGNIILIPLVEATFGAGTGMSDTKSSDVQSGGGGLGARISPVAVVVIVDGTVQLVDVKNKDSANKLIDMIPGILSKIDFEKLFSKKSNDEAEEAETEEAV